MTTAARHRFEFRMFDWAESFSRSLCGSRCGFFLAIRDEGTPRRIYFAAPAAPGVDSDQKHKLAATYERWLLYAPGDEPGMGYLEWFGLDRSVAERFVGRAFEPTDFLDVRTTATCEWPDQWRVQVR